MKDYMGNPIIVAVEPVGKGQYYGIHIPSNVTLSGYGKDSFDSFWEKAVKEQRILYAEESDRLTNLGVHFPNVLQTAAFDTIIRNYRELVNRKLKKDAKIFGNSLQFRRGVRSTLGNYFREVPQTPQELQILHWQIGFCHISAVDAVGFTARGCKGRSPLQKYIMILPLPKGKGAGGWG